MEYLTIQVAAPTDGSLCLLEHSYLRFHSIVDILFLVIMTCCPIPTLMDRYLRERFAPLSTCPSNWVSDTSEDRRERDDPPLLSYGFFCGSLAMVVLRLVSRGPGMRV